MMEQQERGTQADEDTWPHDERICWICLCTESESVADEWRSPCLCIGSTKWVHERCLIRWINEKQAGNRYRTVACPQCRFAYRIVYPSTNFIYRCAEVVDKFVRRLCPFIAGSVFAISIYWDMASFGALTVLQVLGEQHGLDLLENTHPMILLVVMPSIPVLLIVTQFIRWEDGIMKVMEIIEDQARWLASLEDRFIADFIGTAEPNANTPRLVLEQQQEAVEENSQLAGAVAEPEAEPQPQPQPEADADAELEIEHAEVLSLESDGDENEIDNSFDGDEADNVPEYRLPISITEIICNALMMPSISTFVGHCFFSHVESNFRRAICGGLTYIIARGLANIVLRRRQISLNAQRRLLDYAPIESPQSQ